MLAGASLEAEASSSTMFSVNSSNNFNRSCNGASRAASVSSFLFLFSVSVESCNKSPRAQLRRLRLRVVAGLGVEPSVVESCGTDVENVLVVEVGGLVDNPGTTMGTYFSVLHRIFCLLVYKNAFFDHWSSRRNIHDLRRVFQAIELLVYPRGSVLSRMDPN